MNWSNDNLSVEVLVKIVLLLLPAITWHNLETTKKYFACFMCSFMDFFLSKYVLIQVLVMNVFYLLKITRIVFSESFLRCDNVIYGRNLHHNLAQFRHRNSHRYLNYFCCHFDFLIWYVKSTSVGDKKQRF